MKLDFIKLDDHRHGIFIVLADLPDYLISAEGRVFRIRAGRNHTKQHGVGSEVKGGLNNHGYWAMTLHDRDGRKRHFNVHALVARAFLGPKPTPAHQVAHWDGDRLNNWVPNLRWATPQENAEDTVRHGRTTKGSKSKLAKLTEDQVRRIRREYDPPRMGVQRLADRFGVAKSTMSMIVTGKIWKHVA